MGNNQSYLDGHDYIKIKEIGKEELGMATIVKSKTNGETAVIKEVPSTEMAKKEVSILQDLNHPNIVHYIQSFEEIQNLYIVMEYCEGGDLSDKIKEQKEKKVNFQEDKIIEWFAQICLALEHAHDNNVIHRNLKPQNVFFAKNEQIKLGDLGRIFQRPDRWTTWNTCPEVLHDHPYTNKSDMWSLGCVLYELCMLESSMGKTSISKSYSSELQDLVKQLLMNKPEYRPTAKEVLQKPFIQRHIQSPIMAKVLQHVEKKEPIDVTDSKSIFADRSEEDAIAACSYCVQIISKLPKEYVDDLQKVIKDLYALADVLESQHRNFTIGSLGGSVTGAAGGIMSIVGIALTPFTLGASLIVTGVGIGVAVAGGAVGATSNIAGMVKQSNIRKIVEEKYQVFHTKIDPLITALAEIEISSTYFQQVVNDESSSYAKLLNGVRAGKVLGAATEIARLSQVLSIGRVAAQAAKAVRVASALTGVLSGLFLILDVAFIASDAKEVYDINVMKENNTNPTDANPGHIGTGTSRANLLEEEKVPRSNTLKIIKEIRKIAAQYQTALDEVRRAITMVEKEQKNTSFHETASLSSMSSLSLSGSSGSLIEVKKSSPVIN